MESRTDKGLKNIYVSLGLYLFQLFFSVVSRTVFINLLGTEYLGVSGLFSNILSILTLAESGIGNAMTYALYRPLKIHDTEQIKSIMKLYKNLYNFVGIGILIIGGTLAPFLRFLIKDMPENIPYLTVYYLIYVLHCGVSYFNSYKRTILICDQKLYLSNYVRATSYILLAIFQTIALLISKDFMIYLIVMVLMTVSENYIVSYIATKRYSYLKDKNIRKVDECTKVEIASNVKSIFLLKVGNALISSTDNIILSKFVGLVVVGLYSNYTLFVNVATRIMDNVFSSLTASVGNLLVDDDMVHSKDILNKMIFAAAVFHGFISVGMFCMLEPLISLWVGDSYTMGTDVLLIICINYYISGIRRPVSIFKDAAGLFRKDRYRALVEAFINLAVSIPMTILWGIKGTLFGTMISAISFSFWYEAKILYSQIFHSNIWDYLNQQFRYCLIFGGIGTVSFIVTGVIPYTNWIVWIMKSIVCVIVMCSTIFTIFRRNKYFLFYAHLFKDKLLVHLVKTKH